MMRHKELIDGCRQARLLDRLVKGTAVAGASPPSLSVLQPWPARHAQRWRGGGRKADGQCSSAQEGGSGPTSRSLAIDGRGAGGR